LPAAFTGDDVLRFCRPDPGAASPAATLDLTISAISFGSVMLSCRGPKGSGLQNCKTLPAAFTGDDVLQFCRPDPGAQA
jgi:hypothetical protein